MNTLASRSNSVLERGFTSQLKTNPFQFTLIPMEIPMYSSNQNLPNDSSLVVEAIDQHLVNELAKQLINESDIKVRQRLTKEMGRKQCRILQILNDRPIAGPRTG